MVAKKCIRFTLNFLFITCFLPKFPQCTGFLKLPLQDIFVITRDNFTSEDYKVNQLSIPIVRNYEDFLYNLITVTNLGALHEAQFNLGTHSILFYYVLKKFTDLEFAFNEISARRTQMKSGMFKFIIRLHIDSERDIDLDRFKQMIERKVQDLSFFQDNPLLVQIWTDHQEYCLVAYRIDNLAGGLVVKKICRHPADKSCFSGTVEGVIDSKLSRDFGGTNLIVSAVDSPYSDYDMVVEYVNDKVVFKSGFALEVLEAMKQLLNFTVTPTTSIHWGKQIEIFPEEKWEGAIGDMVDGKIDLVISSTSTTGLRNRIVDFNFATHPFSVEAFFREFCSYRTKAFPILSPFQRTLWLTILGWIVVNAIAYKLLKKFLCRECQAGKRDDDFQAGLGSWGFPPICNQGAPDTPVHYTLRTLYVLQFVVSLVLYAAFAGTLVSFVSISKNPISRLDDLIDPKFGLEVGIDPIIKLYIEQTRINFEEAADAVFRKSKVVRHWDIRLILREKMALIVDDTTAFRDLARLKHKHPTDPCWVGSIPMYKSPQYQGTYVKRHSGMRRAFGVSIIKMMETGNVNRWRKKHLPGPPACLGMDAAMFFPASIRELNFAYYVLFAGLIIAPLFLFFEFTTQKGKEQN